jgi:hypothetical protein
MSAIGFAYFGSLLAKQGSIRAGYKFALLAKNLLDKLNAKDIAGEVINILAEIVSLQMPCLKLAYHARLHELIAGSLF